MSPTEPGPTAWVDGTDAAGMPKLPMLVRYEEIAAGAPAPARRLRRERLLEGQPDHPAGAEDLRGDFDVLTLGAVTL